MTPYIELKNVCKKFAGVNALQNVSIAVNLGEVHALVGENGAGKSTLIKIISGYHQPTSGQCFVEGREVKISDPSMALKLHIGVVYQELSVVDNLSVAENIYFGRLPHNKLGRVQWKKLYRDAQEILDRIGLNIPVRRKVGSLGTAQKQLVEIARCLSQNPKFIIMDEPTSSLAPKEISNLLEIIRRLRSQNVPTPSISNREPSTSGRNERTASGQSRANTENARGRTDRNRSPPEDCCCFLPLRYRNRWLTA